MRRALRQSLPTLAHYFGLMPWDLERLTPTEAHVFVDWLNARAEQAKKRGR